MPTSTPSYALIMAGGSGTRLWPMSRNAFPKQFQPLLGEETPFQHMVRLLTQVIPIEKVFVQITPAFKDFIREQAPQIPTANILIEPSRRDTGPAVIYGLMEIVKRDPDAIVTTVWSDHVVTKPEVFAKVLTTCIEAATALPNHLVTVGAKPVRVETGYGHIGCAEELRPGVFAVSEFVEKPGQAKAEGFMESGKYLWNVGYNTMRASTFLQELKKVRSDLAETLESLQQAVTGGDSNTIVTAFEALPKTSVDFLVVQQFPHMAVVPADMGWSDIGNWAEVYRVRRENYPHSVVTSGDVWIADSHDSLVYATTKPVAMIGVSDVVVVETDDAILVMNRRTPPSELKQFLNDTISTANPDLL